MADAIALGDHAPLSEEELEDAPDTGAPIREAVLLFSSLADLQDAHKAAHRHDEESDSAGEHQREDEIARELSGQHGSSFHGNRIARSS